MAKDTLSPLGAVARGAVAGAVGTAAMTAVQMAYYKATGAEGSDTPGEVGRRIGEGVLHRNVPDDKISTLTQLMHWAYGTSWGVPYAVVAGSFSDSGSLLRDGTAITLTVWGAGQAQLPAMKLAPPPWESSPSALAMDLGFHVVYGFATALAFRVLR